MHVEFLKERRNLWKFYGEARVDDKVVCSAELMCARRRFNRDSSTAIIEPGAKLADDVQVGPYSYIGNDVEIGAGTIIESHVVLKSHPLGQTTHLSIARLAKPAE